MDGNIICILLLLCTWLSEYGFFHYNIVKYSYFPHGVLLFVFGTLTNKGGAVKFT
jgi:hypothetical protein